MLECTKETDKIGSNSVQWNVCNHVEIKLLLWALWCNGSTSGYRTPEQKVACSNPVRVSVWSVQMLCSGFRVLTRILHSRKSLMLQCLSVFDLVYSALWQTVPHDLQKMLRRSKLLGLLVGHMLNCWLGLLHSCNFRYAVEKAVFGKIMQKTQNTARAAI